MEWKITALGDLPLMLLFFIMHVGNCIMGARPMVQALHQSKM